MRLSGSGIEVRVTSACTGKHGDRPLSPWTPLRCVAGNEVLDALGWLLKRQPWIGRSKAAPGRHLNMSNAHPA